MSAEGTVEGVQADADVLAPIPAALDALRTRRMSATVRAEREHIVRVLHSHPIYLAWLRDHVAAALVEEAQRLTDAGHETAGALLAARAVRRRAGTGL